MSVYLRLVSVYFEILQPVRCRPLLFDVWRIVIRFSKIYAINLSEALAWEQRKFGGLLESVPSKTFIKSPEINGKYEVVQQGNDPIMGYANGYPCEDYQETVIFGDHTLSLYKPQAPFFVATDGVRIVKGKDKSDGFFLFTLLEKYKPQSEGYKRYFSILSDTSCYFAKNLSEQQKIGEYFECINSLITLHQREHL